MASNQRITKQLELEPGVPVIGYAFHFVLVDDGKVIEAIKERAEALDIADKYRVTGREP